MGVSLCVSFCVCVSLCVYVCLCVSVCVNLCIIVGEKMRKNVFGELSMRMNVILICDTKRADQNKQLSCEKVRISNICFWFFFISVPIPISFFRTFPGKIISACSLRQAVSFIAGVPFESYGAPEQLLRSFTRSESYSKPAKFACARITFPAS